MRILIASSEVHPYSKTGGLADMVGALAKMLARKGNRVGVVTPLYAGIRERFPDLKRANLPLELPLGARSVRAETWGLNPAEGLTVYFVDQPSFYDRADLYQQDGADYPDNAERFIFLSKVAAHLAVHLDWQPEVLHLHDWQTSLAALLIKHQGGRTTQRPPPGVCLTIHNLAYQGLFPGAQYELTNLPGDYFTPAGVEFYGQLSCLKAGIVYADVITTVSPRYAREITTEEMGCGLDGLLRQRNSSLVGILNGVDYEEWNPKSDPFIKYPYCAKDLSAKTANKLELQKEFGLPVDASIPLFGNIGRLAEQKGVEILLGALEEMLSANLQFVAIGNGSPAFQRAYHDLARRFPAQVGVRVGFDGALSHRIKAGCDFFLMPSRFEPCGLNQMYGLRYGTIPIVRTTGGLDDTVIDAREEAGKANGIKFAEYSSTALAKGMRKALALFTEPETLKRFRLNGMTADFSWDRTVGDYLRIYSAAQPQSRTNSHLVSAESRPVK
ncbi:MAG TPA: glycogen synthase GlgA [Candidatus Paceibacterota bacterium]|nr:glycogen synthase GlgA [Verrucomicrobiota bacterium]HSA11880.1 glycogen synthase GlgA [Candidatus Paceibacterota bacterium]